ncbi:hypothetical protein DFH27DRAFT_550864 [Peziza echinospora]|nr:hypothetical protein DFH27DRAFT_550864 [Peziza echinospora]
MRFLGRDMEGKGGVLFFSFSFSIFMCFILQKGKGEKIKNGLFILFYCFFGGAVVCMKDT